MATTLTDNFCRACGGSTGETVADHELKADPHPQYLTQTEGDALYADAAEIAAAVTAHEADAGDPHAAAGYLTAADVGSFATEAYADNAVATHAAAPDPHPNYALDSEVTTAISNHAAAADPHPNYALEAFTEDRTGWAHYQDDTVTAGSPTTLVASTPTSLPNAADTVTDGELPDGITEFYETTGSTIVVDAATDLLDVQIELVCDPTVTGQWLDIWIDDNGGAGNAIGRQTFSLIKGATPHSIIYRLQLRGSAALVTNGGTVRVESGDTPDLYDIRYLISRQHLTRTT